MIKYNKGPARMENIYLKLIIAKQYLSFLSSYWYGILFSITLRINEITRKVAGLLGMALCYSALSVSVYIYLQVMIRAGLQSPGSDQMPSGPSHPPMPPMSQPRCRQIVGGGRGWWMRGMEDVGCWSAVSERGEWEGQALPLTLQSHTTQSGLVSHSQDYQQLSANKVGATSSIYFLVSTI